MTARREFLKAAAGGLGLATSTRTHAQAPATPDRTTDLRARRDGEAVLVCAGDWFLTRRVSDAVTSETDAVFNVLRRADASFANLENGLSTIGSGDLGGFRQGAPLRGDPALASELAWGGVRAVSLANNHTGNFGRDALLQTIATLDTAKVAHAGAGANLERAAAPAFVKAGALTVAFLSVYTLYHEFGADDQATATQPGLNVCRAYDVVVQPQVGFDPVSAATAPFIVNLHTAASHTIMAASRGDIDRLKAAIRQAASRADFTLLSVHIHWGRHTKHDLPPNLRAFAYETIDAGVDLFVGHGPHAIRGVERYRGKPIVHSVGNFVLTPPAPGGAAPSVLSERHEGLLVRASVTRQSVRALELLPIAMDAKGDPRFPSSEQTARTIGKLGGLSAALGLDISAKGWFGEAVLE